MRLSRQRPKLSQNVRGGVTTRRREGDRDLLERSALHREYLAEQEEILRLKWLESEKAGRDIGIEYARAIWITCHRALWRKARLAPIQAN